MNALIQFLLMLCLCLLLGAVLAYPLYLSIDGIASLVGNDVVIRFHKVVSRLTLILVLLGLWWFVKAQHLDNRQALGYDLPRRRFLGAMLKGWVFGVGTLLVLATALMWLGAREWHIDPDTGAAAILLLFLKALTGGLLIGFIEETFFRGALYSAIRHGWNVLAAILATAAFYSAVHFLRTSIEIDPAQVEWSSGFSVLADSFAGFSKRVSLDGFLALLAVGSLLGLVRWRSNGIAYCIGIHAGWVFVIKFTKHLTEVQPASPWAFLVSSYDGLTGYLAAAWIALLMILVWRLRLFDADPAVTRSAQRV